MKKIFIYLIGITVIYLISSFILTLYYFSDCKYTNYFKGELEKIRVNRMADLSYPTKYGSELNLKILSIYTLPIRVLIYEIPFNYESNHIYNLALFASKERAGKYINVSKIDFITVDGGENGSYITVRYHLNEAYYWCKLDSISYKIIKESK